MPYSHEDVGHLRIANYCPLVDGSSAKFDVVIAESKSGKNNRPNTVWSNHDEKAVAYLLNFIGLCEHDSAEAASTLARNYQYENEQCRFRYIIISKEPNEYYVGKGVTYFTFRDLARFFVEIRGQCWVEANLGVASVKQQWDPMIKTLFEIANCKETTEEERVERALGVIFGANEERAPK